jgi:hypothetical protein
MHMKTSLQTILRSTLAGLAICLLTAATQAAGLLTPAGGNLPALSIKDHHVDVDIEDGYAITTIDQVFDNPHGQNLEAHYSFPLPEKGAVAGSLSFDLRICSTYPPARRCHRHHGCWRLSQPHWLRAGAKVVAVAATLEKTKPERA